VTATPWDKQASEPASLTAHLEGLHVALASLSGFALEFSLVDPVDTSEEERLGVIRAHFLAEQALNEIADGWATGRRS
jgi:hypothetical protein